ncbi:OmpA family protein [Pectobacterium sp. PL64]|uniref:OmpA/MotB family protein n=1 Tax=Pectobacterium sp. PL64 TaxID=2738983 RepID=UPI001F0BFDDE|nr:OmpA family protein [Pectobacterium sp. PL64]UMO87472.1 OmpA family protein [Pectobacterium sp. PL64]
MNNPLLARPKADKEDFWISLSDLMTSLMMIFLLISVVYMIKVQEMIKIPSVYKDTLQGLGQALQHEFKDDLKRWHATIDEDLTVRFQEPNILFTTSSSELKPEFKSILDDFIPRYLGIMTDKKYIDNIEEIRIEGHTSTMWRTGVSENDAYFHNMELSQSRTRTTLSYIMNMPAVSDSKSTLIWFKNHVRAIGFSSAKPIDVEGKIITSSTQVEDSARSQRVEFRVRTNVERQVANIVEKGKKS